MKIFSLKIGWHHLALGLLGSALLVGMIEFWPTNNAIGISERFALMSSVQPFKISAIEQGIARAVSFIRQDIFGVKSAKVVSLEHAPVVPGEEQLTRVNFFLTEPIRASLAIPEAWEGKYRVEEAGRTMNFLFLPSALTSQPVFSLELMTASESSRLASSSASIIKSVDGYSIVYHEYILKNGELIKDLKYQEIKQGIEAVLKSLKVHKRE